MRRTTTSTSLQDRLDLLGLDPELNHESKLLRDTVARLLTDQVADEIGEYYEHAEFPRQLIAEFGKLGILGMSLNGYGCAGASGLDYGIVCRELEAVDSGLRSFVSVQGSLAMYAIRRFGSPEQCESWLPAMTAGDAVGCFGLTEADAGSDPSSMRTTARRNGGDWILNGSKMWITNGNIADVAVVWARTDEGIRGFVVPTDTPGFSAIAIKGKLSLRASITSELTLDDCRLPDDAMLPEADGLGAALKCLNEARYGIVWGTVGAARSCLAAAVEYATTREQFGKPLAGFQLTQSKLVDMHAALIQGSLLARRLAELKDRGELRPEQVSLGKMCNARMAIDTARQARTILGANGVSGEYPVLRHASNLESVLTYEGTEEIHKLVLGRALTGERAFV